MKEFVYKLKRIIKRVVGKSLHYDIYVKNNSDTVRFILKNNSSVVRFGDGEFDLIRKQDIPYQKYEEGLSQKIREIILKGSTEKLVVCLPDVFHDLNRYNTDANNFYYERFFYQNRKFLKRIEKQQCWYGSTFMSRPYIDLKDKKQARGYFKLLKRLWNNKNLLIVEGKFSRSGEGNDLFANSHSIQRIICPSKNAYNRREEIEKAIINHSKHKLTLLMLGPTAKIIIDDLLYLNRQMIDLGHIDSEYEWYKLGAMHKIPIPHKHTAEFNNDDGKVILKKDKKYDQEIIKVIK